MSETVNQNNFKHCAQIQITRISRCRDLYEKLFKKLNIHFDRFGRILKLKVLATGNKNSSANQTTTVAFLQYVRNASHWEAIDFFNNANAIYVKEKKLFFKPCGFTNEDYTTVTTDYHYPCQRIGEFGRPLDSSTLHDNLVTRQREHTYFTRVTNGNPMVVFNSEMQSIHECAREVNSVRLVRSLSEVNAEPSIRPSSSDNINVELPALEDIVDNLPVEENGNIRCITCNQIKPWIQYPEHKNNCTGFSGREKKINDLIETLRDKSDENLNDNDLICCFEDNCFLCLDHFLDCRRKEVKTLNCGHRVHMECFNKLVNNGVPTSERLMEYEFDQNERPTEIQMVDTQFYLSAYTNKTIICPVCKVVTFSQVLNFNDALKRRTTHVIDVD
jgi:hypothetical protein